MLAIGGFLEQLRSTGIPMKKLQVASLTAGITLSIVGGLACLASVAVARIPGQRQSQISKSDQTIESLATQNNRLFGPPNSTTKVIGFVDYQCPACRAHFDQVEQAVKKTPGAAFYVQQFPLPMHDLAKPAAALALAAEARGIFPAVHKALLTGKTLSQPTLDSIAKKYSLDRRLTAKVNEKITKRCNQLLKIPVVSVPSFIVFDSHKWQVRSWEQMIKIRLPSGNLPQRGKAG